ncbi:MAG TPA: hypothetical protein VMM93_02480 [Vicinamibacterales bacterium]|nr:hypothetical protein [Vicinamibacterales bacterium]
MDAPTTRPGPGRSRAAALTVIGLLAILAPISGSQAPAPFIDLTPDGVAAAASKYIAEYQKAFSFLIADEMYRQEVEREDLPTERRQLEGEIYMMYLPADDEWITVRDVARVDGRPVADREDLRRLLLSNTDRGLVDRIANRNAAFNIGTVIRNFNEPTLPLLVLSEKKRATSRYKRTGLQKEGDVMLVTVSFEEQRRPTLVSSATGGAVFAKGSFVIEAGTGRVRETHFELEDGRVKARLTTTYAFEERLDLWVPSVFRERYERRHRGSGLEVVTGEATYTNYKRFQGTGRIK